MEELIIRRLASMPWAESSASVDDEQLAAARAAGYRRKQILSGEGETFLIYVEMGPGFTVKPHSHDAGEVIHILDGSLTPSGYDEALIKGDSVVISAGQRYGFECGSAGVKFLIIRPADAGIDYPK